MTPFKLFTERYLTPDNREWIRELWEVTPDPLRPALLNALLKKTPKTAPPDLESQVLADIEILKVLCVYTEKILR